MFVADNPAKWLAIQFLGHCRDVPTVFGPGSLFGHALSFLYFTGTKGKGLYAQCEFNNEVALAFRFDWLN
ncbi:hypothetical protein NBRC116492_00320 [Aurantivibrio infirmus]